MEAKTRFAVLISIMSIDIRANAGRKSRIIYSGTSSYLISIDYGCVPTGMALVRFSKATPKRPIAALHPSFLDPTTPKYLVDNYRF
jgi:hypothetical protein